MIMCVVSEGMGATVVCYFLIQRLFDSMWREILSNVVYGQLGGDPFFFQPVDKFHSFNNISQALRTMQPYPSFLSTLT